MNVIKFNELDVEQNNNIVYCIIDNTNSYNNLWATELIKNISDWTIQNLTIKGYTVLVSNDEESLIKEALDLKYTFAVVLTTGTEFINGYEFHDTVEEFCKTTDFFIAGHILDRKDFYYELHQQCYIINLKKYAEIGCPRIGTLSYYDKHTEIIPLRSDENIHDNYTPIWVLPGSDSKVYDHKCHGWNIISQALKFNLPIFVFDNRFRQNKKHYYPEHEKTFLNEIHFAFKRDAFCSGLAVYPFNSEDFKKDKFRGPINQLVVPASGLNWILCLKEYNFTSNTVIKFYDYSLPTLEFIKELISSWNGKDYVNFIKQYIDKKFGFLENGMTIPTCGPGDWDAEWKSFLDQCDWDSFWLKLKKLKFEFHWINLLDPSTPVDWIDQVDNTLINVSNIFNYIGTATTHSIKSRVIAENNFINRLKNHLPSSSIIITRRAASGFYNYKNQDITKITLLDETNLNDLKKPTWHMNQDWSI